MFTILLWNIFDVYTIASWFSSYKIKTEHTSEAHLDFHLTVSKAGACFSL